MVRRNNMCIMRWSGRWEEGCSPNLRQIKKDERGLSAEVLSICVRDSPFSLAQKDCEQSI